MLKFDTPTLVTLTAPTCSGKSYILNALTQLGCQRIVSTTTRAPRDGETEGVDYNFITMDESKELEAAGKFFELIEFRGTRYGVTHAEMAGKMAGEFAPVVILEPKGLAIYEQKCREQGWGIYKVYVSTVEGERIRRLNDRTTAELSALAAVSSVGGRYASTFAQLQNEKTAEVVAALPKIIAAHTDRLLSITTEERGWSNTTTWDAIIPGDDITKALAMLRDGASYRNRRVAPPQAIGAVKLPL